MPTMLLRHYFSSLTTTHHPGIHMHINVDVTTLVHCDLIRGMAIAVAAHLQALELWAMALVPPAAPKKCTSERQGRKGGGIVAWRAHHATGQAPGGRGTDSRQGVVLVPWVVHTLWPQPHPLQARHRHPHPLPPPLLPLLSQCIPWQVAVHHHLAVTSTELSTQKNWFSSVWSHLGCGPMLGFQHVIALAKWWREQRLLKERQPWVWPLVALSKDFCRCCGNVEDIYSIDKLVKHDTYIHSMKSLECVVMNATCILNINCVLDTLFSFSQKL